MKYHFSAQPRHRAQHQRAIRSLAPKSNRQSAGLDVSQFVNSATIPAETVVYQARHQFDQFGLDPHLVKNLSAKGYKTPTPIQDQSIKPILENHDLIGMANTGTGKTAAFLLPIIHQQLHNHIGPALIIVPTRELATQIYDECRAFCHGLPISMAICVGGQNIRPQITALKRQPHIIIGTPGRLKDLSNQKQLPLDQCTTLVLDEVDRMLDMGFIRDIRFLIAQLPHQRQSLFFSATTTPEIDRLAQSLLQQPITVSVRTRPTSEQVNQDILYANSKEHKLEQLETLLKQPDFQKVLVFGNTKWGVEKIARKLHQAGFGVAAIHGNKSQPQRQRALNEFKAGRIQALIATDVAARGIDISGVSHVINFDVPNSYEDYIHRIGRTGRAGHVGKALTFVPQQ